MPLAAMAMAATNSAIRTFGMAFALSAYRYM
jgi:hypothetical protein